MHIFVYSKPKEQKSQTLCEACQFERRDTRATKFCMSCDVPEPLCKDCARQHNHHKATRGQKICDDIEQIRSLQRGPLKQ